MSDISTRRDAISFPPHVWGGLGWGRTFAKITHLNLITTVVNTLSPLWGRPNFASRLALATSIKLFLYPFFLGVLAVQNPPDLDSFIQQAMRDFDVPGVSVAIVHHDQIIYTTGIGQSSGGQPITPDTPFMIGSITKSMTVLTLATLVDDGTLTWETPVTDILPQFPLSDTIRVRDLVNHASGLPRHDLPLLLHIFPPDELIASLEDIPVTAPPGERFGYNNQMVATAGYLAAAATGAGDLYTGYTDLVQSRLFDPLDMHSTTFDVELQGPEQFALSVMPAGGAWSTANDMAKYMRMILNDGLTEAGTRLVRDLSQTWTPGVPVIGTVTYGMGWFIDSYHNQPLIYHGGNTFHYTSDFAFLPDSDFGVIILANKGLANNFTLAIRNYIFEDFLNIPHNSYQQYLDNERNLRQHIDMLIPPVDQPVNIDQHILGTYEYDVTVSYENGGLFLNTYTSIPLYSVADVDVNAAGVDEFNHTGGWVFRSVGDVMGGLVVEFQHQGDDITATLSLLLDPTQRLTIRKLN